MAIAGRVAIVPKGEWDSSISYEKLDVVSYNNALYMAKKPSVGQVPADGEYWMLCVQSIDYSEFEKIINGTTTVGIADKAINDKNGDGIVDTYAKKNDLTNFQNKDGDSKDNTVTYTSADDTTADAWTDVAVLATGEKHSSLFAKISTMFKNIRYIYTHFIKSENILETLEEIVANTQSGKVAGALAVKELNSNLPKFETVVCSTPQWNKAGTLEQVFDISFGKSFDTIPYIIGIQCTTVWGVNGVINIYYPTDITKNGFKIRISVENENFRNNLSIYSLKVIVVLKA